MTVRIALSDLDAAGHFRLLVFGVVLHACEQRADADTEVPFVRAYRAQAARLADRAEPPPAAQWFDALDRMAAEASLPFARLSRTGFAPLAARLLATVAMVEEDPSLAYLIEPEGGLPTLGGLIALWRHVGANDRAGAVRDAVFELRASGLLAFVDAEAMRLERRLRVPEAVLDVLSGGTPRVDGAPFEPIAALPQPAEWIAPAEQAMLDPVSLGALVRGDPSRVLLVRGPGHNGRRMLLRATARVAGLAVLHVPQAMLADAGQWQLAGAIAQLTGAMVVAELTPAPGETLTVSAHPTFAGPIGIAIGPSGAVRVEGAATVLGIDLPAPTRDARARQWRAHGVGALAQHLSPMAMTLGHITRAARSAAGIAELAGRRQVTRADVRIAARQLRDARLDALASPVDRQREPEPLFLNRREQDEFDALILRARHREALGLEPGSALDPNRGVRALFAGPSGTGKTLAARHIAARLEKDLYRIDLAATVSKYIGETEKCLDRALSAAEELDVVLLLDEGDALMARRTDVGSSNDRYANLETNFLLQRIESFEGVILVTTNDPERIDQAFARRLDAVLTFRAPDAVMRRDILARQLGDHAVSPTLLDDVACRCTLTGGQLRNVALHARLLALDRGERCDDLVLRAAIEREYRKTGGFCPLKPTLAVAS